MPAESDAFGQMDRLCRDEEPGRFLTPSARRTELLKRKPNLEHGHNLGGE